jgi:hypothetical protein
MKRLLAQFSPEESRALTPEAKNKWLALIRSHASAYLSEAAGVRNELRPIYANAAGAATESVADISDDAALIRAVNRLVEVASSNDSTIRSAFAMSATGKSSAIGSPKFWQSWKNAEALATRIQSAH